MAKYSTEFKLMVVKEYLSGTVSYKNLAEKYSIPSRTSIMEWVSCYNELGVSGLARKKKQVYTFEFKLHAVELYLSGGISYQKLAFKLGMHDHSLISSWVNAYRAVGEDALKPRKKGRLRKMDKDKIIKSIKEGDSEEQKRLLEELQEENLKLRIENAFLKELRRLRLEEEELLNEQRELSTVSEENSD